MALNIKNAEVEQLAEEIARVSKSTKTEESGREERLRHFLEMRVWPTIPPEASRPWSRDEEDAALGYGESGEPA
jgi:Rv0623-like transcription factor